LSSLLRESSWGAPFESHFIVKFLGKLPSYEPLDEFQNFDALVNAILRQRAIQQRRPQLDPAQLFSRLQEKSYRMVTDEICYQISRQRKSDALSWGDKTPAYTLEAEALIELFPEAYFIYLTRDGRDVALSLMKKRWGPGNAYACARMWRQYIDKKATIQSLLTTGNLTLVRYEDLLRDPDGEIERIYDFLGESCPPEEIGQLVQSTRRGNYDKWKTQMSAEDLETFEKVAADALQSAGYEVRHEQAGVAGWKVAGYLATDWLKRARHKVALNTVDSFAIRFLGKDPFRD